MYAHKFIMNFTYMNDIYNNICIIYNIQNCCCSVAQLCLTLSNSMDCSTVAKYSVTNFILPIDSHRILLLIFS